MRTIVRTAAIVTPRSDMTAWCVLADSDAFGCFGQSHLIARELRPTDPPVALVPFAGLASREASGTRIVDRDVWDRVHAHRAKQSAQIGECIKQGLADARAICSARPAGMCGSGGAIWRLCLEVELR